MNDIIITQAFLARQSYMIVAVMLLDGSSWAIPVKLQRWQGSEFEWDSRTDTQHSQAIEKNPRIAISLFEVKEDSHFGYYAQANASIIARKDNERARYRATITRAWINDQTFVKRELIDA